MGEIRMQSQGLEVRRCQEILNRLITVQPPLRVDGIFGPKTRDRVMAFQRQSNLAPDGIVGPKTNRALVISVLNDVTDDRRYR
jgi:peptidoglycan hydrolase-like protein with peptidoglycan-binding domain